MLFAGGASGLIQLDLHNLPAGCSRPVDGHMLTDSSESCTTQAQRAAKIAWKLANKKGLTVPPYAISFDVTFKGEDRQIIQDSGGLAMALAGYRRLAAIHPPPMAATGAISSVGDGGKISKVNGIPAKLQEALTLAKPGWIVFYPAANSDDVKNALQEDFRRRDVLLQPVSSVAEAVALLEGQDGAKQEGPEQFQSGMAGKTVLLAVICLAAIVLLGIGVKLRENRLTVQPVVMTTAQPVAPATVKGQQLEEKSAVQTKNPVNTVFNNGFE